MRHNDMEQAIKARLARIIDEAHFTGASASVAWRGGEAHAGVGDLDPDRMFFAASATKLCVTALMLRGVARGLWQLDDPAVRHGLDLRGLAVWRGEDLGASVTLRDLMAHTSGIPDYMQATAGQGVLADLAAGRDRTFGYDDMIGIARGIGAVARPGDRRRAHYSDTNYQLLGRLIAQGFGADFADLCRDQLFAPLGMSASYIYTNPDDRRPVALRSGPRAVDLPLAMASVGADGGMVMTTQDGLRFVQGFFGGALFDPGALAALQDWRPMFFPLQYGTGLMRFSMPWLLAGFRQIPPMIGHSGVNGTILFAVPDQGFYIAASVNQIARRSTVYRLAMDLWAMQASR
ncbi:MAG: serine hydrolase domain-containing protein [Paracoccus sp. (in: a-proteobacteria)]|nr:serine hydrolase domain-containing protein [Paracoccus sp. (in: a-proteobacteria)]